MIRNDDHDAEPTTALELANSDADLVRTEVLQGELLDAESLATATPDGSVRDTNAAEGAGAATAHVERPTIRWGALVWGLLFATTAGLVFWMLGWGANRDEALAVAMALDPVSVLLYSVLAVGVVVVLFGIVGLIRRAERKRRAARG